MILNLKGLEIHAITKLNEIFIIIPYLEISSDYFNPNNLIIVTTELNNKKTALVKMLHTFAYINKKYL